MARVSIVIPAYNSVDFIRATLDSVFAQTYRDFEVIVSDHSSTDGTSEILAAYADTGRIRYYQQPTGGGAPANWRAVTDRADGEYLKLVCGDDLLAPTILEDQVRALDENKNAVMAASQRDLIDADGKPIMGPRGLQGLRNGLSSGRDAVRVAVRHGANIFGEPGCVLFRHEAFLAAGGWDDEFPFVIDQYSYLNTLMRGDFVAVPGSLASFRVSAGQWSVNLTKQHVRGHKQTSQPADPGLAGQLPGKQRSGSDAQRDHGSLPETEHDHGDIDAGNQ